MSRSLPISEYHIIFVPNVKDDFNDITFTFFYGFTFCFAFIFFLVAPGMGLPMFWDVCSFALNVKFEKLSWIFIFQAQYVCVDGDGTVPAESAMVW